MFIKYLSDGEGTPEPQTKSGKLSIDDIESFARDLIDTNANTGGATLNADGLNTSLPPAPKQPPLHAAKAAAKAKAEARKHNPDAPAPNPVPPRTVERSVMLQRLARQAPLAVDHYLGETAHLYAKEPDIAGQFGWVVSFARSHLYTEALRTCREIRYEDTLQPVTEAATALFLERHSGNPAEITVIRAAADALLHVSAAA